MAPVTAGSVIAAAGSVEKIVRGPVDAGGFAAAPEACNASNECFSSNFGMSRAVMLGGRSIFSTGPLKLATDATGWPAAGSPFKIDGKSEIGRAHV